jgi:hypothetical protein
VDVDLMIPTPTAADCSSYHCEVTAPEQIGVCAISRQYVSPSRVASKVETSTLAENGRISQRSHVHSSDLEPGTDVIFRFALRPRSSLLRSASLAGMLTVFVIAGVILGNAIVDHDSKQMIIDPAATILLAAASVVSLYVVRENESHGTATFLSPVRSIAAAPIFLAFVASVSMVALPDGTARWIVLIASLALTLIVTGLIIKMWRSVRKAELR